MVPIRTTNMHFMNCILDAEDLEELDFALNGETPLYEAKFDRNFYLRVHDARGNDVTAALPEEYQRFFADNFMTFGRYSVYHEVQNAQDGHHWRHYQMFFGLTEDEWINANHSWLTRLCPTERHMRALYRALSAIDNRIIEEQNLPFSMPSGVVVEFS